MRTVEYTCDRCHKPVDRTKVVSYRYRKSVGSVVSEKQVDFCNFCNTRFQNLTQSFLAGNDVASEMKPVNLKLEIAKENNRELKESTGVVESGTETENAVAEVLEKKYNRRVPKAPTIRDEDLPPYEPVPLKTGNIKPKDVEMIVRYTKMGLTPEQIAPRVGRTVRGINICLSRLALKEQEESEEEEERKESESTDKTVTKVSDAKESGGTNEDSKKLDEGGIIALAKAGWTPRRIASEHSCSVDRVLEVLENSRKKL